MRDQRETVDSEIDKFEKDIARYNNNKQSLAEEKRAKDMRKKDYRNLINANERKKMKYLNGIEISLPIRLSQFQKFEMNSSDVPSFISLEISKAVLFTESKMNRLQNLKVKILERIVQNEDKIKEFRMTSDKDEIENKLSLEYLRKIKEQYDNDQNLKFGTKIKFANLLKTAKNNNVSI